MAWQPVAKTHLGDIDLTKPNAYQTYNLSEAYVPRAAKEVLVYATVKTGTNTGQDTDIELALWTTDVGLQYKKYLFAHMYGQNAWSYNSDNMFFPVTPDMTLYAQWTGSAASGNSSCQLYVIGYRL